MLKKRNIIFCMVPANASLLKFLFFFDCWRIGGNIFVSFILFTFISLQSLFQKIYANNCRVNCLSEKEKMAGRFGLVAVIVLCGASLYVNSCKLSGLSADCENDASFREVDKGDRKIKDVYWRGGSVMPDIKAAANRFNKMRVSVDTILRLSRTSLIYVIFLQQFFCLEMMTCSIEQRRVLDEFKSKVRNCYCFGGNGKW
jgi:hypothetical protein